MKLIVISDTHLNFPDERLEKVFASLNSEDILIHCGDFGTENVLNYFTNYPKFYAVRGNCDNFLTAQSLPATQIINFSGFNIGIVHGAGFKIPSQLPNIFYQKPDILLFGHTHRRFVDKINGILFCNPGSFSLPRDGIAPSFLEINLQKLPEINFLEVDIADKKNLSR